MADTPADMVAAGGGRQPLLFAVPRIRVIRSRKRGDSAELGNGQGTITRFSRLGESDRWQIVPAAVSGGVDLYNLMIDSIAVRIHRNAGAAKSKPATGKSGCSLVG
jgi:hypothetical protein